MNISKILKSFSVVTTLTVASALAGCAVEAPADGADVASNTTEAAPVAAPAEQAPALTPVKEARVGNDAELGLGLGPQDIVKQMATSLVDIAMHQIAGELFPSNTINVEKLLENIDAQTRQAIFDEAMRSNRTHLDAALIVFKNAEIAKATIGQPDAKTGAQIYQEVVNSSTLNNITDVVAGTGGESASVKFQRGGLRLYALGQQMTANRLMLQIELQPSTATSDRAILISTLREARAHVLKVVNEYRAEEINNRMNAVKDCEVYHVDYNIISGTTYYTRFHEDAEGRYWGNKDSHDRATALGRCEQDRDGHMQRVQMVRTQQLNNDYTFELEMADLWAKAADALENKTAAQSSVTKGLDFGGMWGYVQDSETGPMHGSINPYTGASSCPPGYTQSTVTGKYNVDYEFYQCTRPSNGVAEPIADFGGMFGDFDYREARFTGKNPITGTSGCPDGFTATKVLGNFGGDSNLFMCSKPHVAGVKPATTFGGVYSRISGHINPASNGASCAPGFVPNQVWGSNGTNGWKVDQAVDLCTLAAK